MGRRNQEWIKAIERGEVKPIAPQRMGKPEISKLVYQAGVDALATFGIALPDHMRRR